MRVLFIHGPAASGKHTIGNLVSQELEWPLFHNHLTVDLAKTLFDFGTKEFCQLRADIWRSSFRLAAEADQSFIFTYNPENTVDPAVLEDLKGLVESSGGRVLYIELQCSDDEVARRLSNKSRAKFDKLTDVGLFRELTAQGVFDTAPLPEAWLCLDTESISAAQAAEIILSEYRALD